MSKKIALSPNGIFSTIQGEGSLLGLPMHFVRLAGCSVGCPGCDTDYSVSERLSVAEIIERLQRLNRLDWVWITGGEPTDQGIGNLVLSLRNEGYNIALATSGVRSVCKDGWNVETGGEGVDFLSVSPHFSPSSSGWKVRKGSQLNVVHGLNGLNAFDFSDVDSSLWQSMWVTPVWLRESDRMSNVSECVDFVSTHKGWRLGIQSHKQWGVA